jgi:malonate decarboxylase delta subunit
MIETLTYTYAATSSVANRAHVGVVASGNCELLLEPAGDERATVLIRTSVRGYGDTWNAVLERFFDRHPVAVHIEINDFGATPAVVALRLEQALEQSR